jgi:hypothetical protein
VLAEYKSSLAKLERIRVRMESLLDSGHVLVREIGLVYESLFLRAVTVYEEFCEEFFFKLLAGTVQYAKAKRIAPLIRECDTIREIVLQGDKYLEWIPYDRIKRRASLYLKGGRPFSSLEEAEKDKISRITKIRNAIAHKSKNALETFKDDVIGGMPLLPHEKSPAGFLRSELSPGRKRFQAYVEDLVAVAEKLYGKPI